MHAWCMVMLCNISVIYLNLRDNIRNCLQGQYLAKIFAIQFMYVTTIQTLVWADTSQENGLN